MHIEGASASARLSLDPPLATSLTKASMETSEKATFSNRQHVGPGKGFSCPNGRVRKCFRPCVEAAPPVLKTYTSTAPYDWTIVLRSLNFVRPSGPDGHNTEKE